MAAEGTADESWRKKTLQRNLKQSDDSPGIEESDAPMMRPLCEQMTDAGQFGYAAVCAMSLNQLYEQPCHKDFNMRCIKTILAHLQQPKQVETSILAIVSGHGGDSCDPFVSVLSEEDVVEKNPMCIIQDLMAVVLNNGYYDARMRVLIKHIAFLLRVNWDQVEDYEELVVQQLQEEAHSATDEEKKEKKKSETNRKRKRYFLIGLATVGGGALIGLTGGLAAPLLAAGAGAIIGGAGAAALGTTAGIAIIGSLFGVAGAGLTGYKMKKRVGAIEQFEFMPIAESSQLHITIAISGWLSKDEGDFALPWKTLAHSKEQYCLKWEGKYLLQMGQAIDYLFNGVVTVAAQEALKYTILSGIISAIAWPASLVTLAGVIDNPWSVCIRRSAEAGKQLAEVLLMREQGKRPVTLIGYSLGARVIFYCLQEMAKRKGSDGIIEDVILLGTPVTADPKHWAPFARIVSGNIINGYCRGDWLLKFLYRTASAQLRMAGLQPIKWNDRRMLNIDLSDLVSGHTDYVTKIDEILKIVGMKTKEPPKRATALRFDKTPSSSETSTPEHTAGACVGAEDSDDVIVVESVEEKTNLKRLTRTSAMAEVAETALDALALNDDEDDLFVNENPVIPKPESKEGATRDQEADEDVEIDNALVNEIQEESEKVVDDENGRSVVRKEEDKGHMGQWGEWEVDWNEELSFDDGDPLESGLTAGRLDHEIDGEVLESKNTAGHKNQEIDGEALKSRNTASEINHQIDGEALESKNTAGHINYKHVGIIPPDDDICVTKNLVHDLTEDALRDGETCVGATINDQDMLAADEAQSIDPSQS